MLICNKERSKSLERERVLERKIGWKESCLLMLIYQTYILYNISYFMIIMIKKNTSSAGMGLRGREKACLMTFLNPDAVPLWRLSLELFSPFLVDCLDRRSVMQQEEGSLIWSKVRNSRLGWLLLDLAQWFLQEKY